MRRREFDTWEELRAFLDEAPGDRTRYVWRGQRDPSWPLASSLERRLLQLDGSAGGPRALGGARYRDMVAAHLERWKQASSGLRGPAPKDLTEEQWWALGRHFGLMTPMLDWTEKPYVALFFALRGAAPLFGDESDGAAHSARFAMFRLSDCARLAGDNLKIVRTPIDELGRMQQQRGLFTWTRSEEYFDLGALLDATDRGDLLTQALVTADVIPRALHDLELHGIDHRLLFPDLYGAAGFANAQLSLDSLLEKARE